MVISLLERIFLKIYIMHDPLYRRTGTQIFLESVWNNFDQATSVSKPYSSLCSELHTRAETLAQRVEVIPCRQCGDGTWWALGKTDVIIAEQWANNREHKKHRNLEVHERIGKVTPLDCLDPRWGALAWDLGPGEREGHVHKLRLCSLAVLEAASTQYTLETRRLTQL